MAIQTIKNALLASWHSPNVLTIVLYPLSGLYYLLIGLRKKLYQWGCKPVFHADVPVIIIGNVSVGGTGKTPLVMYLYRILLKHGFRPGIISRGYKSAAPQYPYVLDESSTVSLAGDEMYMVYKNSGAPIAIGANRADSIQVLRQKHDVDIIISDDGLQHYALHRDIEICVVDDMRNKANQALLPAGPMREPNKRLQDVHFLISASEKTLEQYAHFPAEKYAMRIEASPQPIAVNAATAKSKAPPSQAQPVYAIAGIGNPERFFCTCRDLGWQIETKAFDDHHTFTESDFDEFADSTILMTEKDAVKCKDFHHPHLWYIEIEAQLAVHFEKNLIDKIRTLDTARK